MSAALRRVQPADPVVCQVHRRHSPEPRVLHQHHIQPESMGGTSALDNMVTVCPTGHYNIHLYLSALVNGTPRPRVTHTEQRYAALGYERWITAGRPGDQHARFLPPKHEE